MNEGEQGALDEEWSAGLILHQLCVAVRLVITHIISHYHSLAQRLRQAVRQASVQGETVDGSRGCNAVGFGRWGHIERLHSRMNTNNDAADSQRLMQLAILHNIIV